MYLDRPQVSAGAFFFLSAGKQEGDFHIYKFLIQNILNGVLNIISSQVYGLVDAKGKCHMGFFYNSRICGHAIPAIGIGRYGTLPAREGKFEFTL
ncbi:MAG: hypothetical protein ACRBG0_21925 [Lewinella sp.]|jgi:hypothetical protein|uniref:hypothetical protein n=1 Tax=Lewinella sp. TaxID=2004506 RepID=UPI003D6C5C68